MKNKYMYRSRISEKKFREILKFFSLDIEAKKAAKLVRLNPNTIDKIYTLIRQRIAEDCERTNPLGSGEIEIDESYFGAKRVKGKRGRGAVGKTPVFGILKREGKVYTQIVKNCSIQELIPIIEKNVDKKSTLYTDGWKAYDGLVNFGYKRHYRVKHNQNEFAIGQNHINGIESFWGLCKVRLSK